MTAPIGIPPLKYKEPSQGTRGRIEKIVQLDRDLNDAKAIADPRKRLAKLRKVSRDYKQFGLLEKAAQIMNLIRSRS